jgi:hypothetical protein
MMDQTFVMLWLGRIVPVLLGGAAGYGYYKFIGCRTGSCPITSSPWISTLYGALVGSLFTH